MSAWRGEAGLSCFRQSAGLTCCACPLVSPSLLLSPSLLSISLPSPSLSCTEVICAHPQAVARAARDWVKGYQEEEGGKTQAVAKIMSLVTQVEIL